MAKDIKGGQATVVVRAIDKTEAGLKAASQSLKKYGSRVAGIGTAIAGAGAAVLGPMAGMASSFAAAGDKLHKMSIRTGIATETLSELAFAAEQSGTDIDQVSSAMFRSFRRIGNAAIAGTGPAARAVELLGLNAKSLAESGPEETFFKLADSLGEVANEAQRNQLGFELFGDNFRQIQPLLAEGSEGMAKLREEARALGRTMTGEDAEAAAAYTDAMNRAKSALVGVKNEIGAALAPAIANLSDNLVASTQGIRDFVADNRELFVAIAGGAAAVTAIGTAVVGLGGVMTAAGVAVGGLATAVGFIVSPIGLAIGGFAALATAVWKYTDWASEAIAWLQGRFGPLVDTVQGSLNAILEAFKTGDMTKAWGLIVDTMDLLWLDLTNGIRDYWDSAMNYLTDASVWMTENAGKAFSALGDFLGDLLDGYKDYYNSVFNFVTEKIGEAGGVRTIGGPVDAFSATGAEDTLRQAIDGIGEFGDTLEDTARATGEERRANRAAMAREREERLAALRSSLSGQADAAEKAASERERMKPPETEKLKEMGELNLAGAAGGGGPTGTFSAFGDMLMGANSPQQRMAQGIEKIAKSNDQILKESKKDRQARFA